jgi:hypothetical protein
VSGQPDEARTFAATLWALAELDATVSDPAAQDAAVLQLASLGAPHAPAAPREGAAQQ